MNINAEGGCACRQIRFRLTAEPIIVHGCHCSWCQRETGGAFAVNAVIEHTHVEIMSGEPEAIQTPSASGRGQEILRCPTCKVALWSHYAGGGPKITFVRVGTLDDPNLFPPDIHIYTSSKQSWLKLPPDAQSVPEFYSPRKIWTSEALARYKAAQSGAE